MLPFLEVLHESCDLTSDHLNCEAFSFHFFKMGPSNPTNHLGLLCAQVTSQRKLGMTFTSPLRSKRVSRWRQSIRLRWVSIPPKPREVVGVRMAVLWIWVIFNYEIF